jgi:hypothetical protein
LQLIIHIDKKICESRALSTLSHEGSPDIPNDASTSIAEKRQPGPSEYELRRQANIAENHRILASLGLAKGGSSALGKLSLKRNNKKYGFCFIYIVFIQL